MKYLIYQAYGSLDILHEAMYSILSYFSIHGKEGISIIVYTDAPEKFEAVFRAGFPITYEVLNDQMIQDWRGDINFVHRVKIKILQAFFEKYKDNALYVDSDTTYIQKIEPLWDALAEGQLIMHTNEGRIFDGKNLVFKRLKSFMKSNEVKNRQGNILRFPVETEMWNAGVLGIPLKYAGLLDEVLFLTDTIYPLHPMHIVEQFAFSYYFQQAGPILPAEEFVFHYWNFKEFRQVLNGFFTHFEGASPIVHLKAIGRIDPRVLEKPKREYEELPAIPKFIRKIRKNRWQIPDYKLD